MKSEEITKTEHIYSEGDKNVGAKFYGSPSTDLPDVLLKFTNLNLVVLVGKDKMITKVIRINHRSYQCLHKMLCQFN